MNIKQTRLKESRLTQNFARISTNSHFSSHSSDSHFTTNVFYMMYGDMGTIFWMDLDWRLAYNQQVSVNNHNRNSAGVMGLDKQCSIHLLMPTTMGVAESHRAAPTVQQGSVLHRYSIGCSFSHVQSQCLGKTTKKIIVYGFSACRYMDECQVVGLTVGPLLVLLQMWSLWYLKKMHWGHLVSHVSADSALAKGQGSQCNDKLCGCEAILRAPPSSWRPSPDHVPSGCAWSPWIPPPVERLDGTTQ